MGNGIFVRRPLALPSQYSHQHARSSLISRKLPINLLIQRLFATCAQLPA